MFNFTADKSQRAIPRNVTCKQAASHLVEDTNLAASLQFIDLSLISVILLG